MIPQRYMILLQLVASTRQAKERKALLKILCRDKKFIKAVKMICSNTAKNQTKLTPREINLLRPHAKVIAKIAKQSQGRGDRAIVQSGGGFILPLIPIITSLIGAAINGANGRS